jgi:polypeptide N-acetylgalactosaminyltransferase
MRRRTARCLCRAWVCAAFVALLRLVHLASTLPNSTSTTREPLDATHGYSTGAACHRIPGIPPESRPLQCGNTAVSAGRASILIITHEEAGCALRRTLLAVGARTPARLLEEAIVVDDASSIPAQQTVAAAGGLGAQPQLHVRWIRSEIRLGVVRSRTAAAAAATTPFLVFLDSHCEPQVGWLEPLLELLGRSPRVVALPVIEKLDPREWAYRPGPDPEAPPRGVIADWNLNFGWKQLTREERAARLSDPIAPLRSPAMAGGVFAITRWWWNASGGYDEHLEVWGVENIEMSLRVWMCGGQLLTLPCSRVGHVFRTAQPFTWPNGSGALTVRKNAWRVGAVWLDDVAPAVGLGISDAAMRVLQGAPGLDERRALRRRLGCRSFRWYLQSVFPDHPDLPKTFRWNLNHHALI